MFVCFFFFFSSRRRHTRCREVSWARRCVQETVSTQSTWDTMESTIEPIAVTAPESLMCLFSTFFGVTDVGISAFLGTNAFTACIERGTLIFLAGRFGEIDWYTGFRDMITYAFTLFCTAMILMDSTIAVWNTIVMLLIFFVYWLFMKFNKYIEKFLRETMRLRKKFKVGPRLCDEEIRAIHCLKRRENEYKPEDYLDYVYEIRDGFIKYNLSLIHI
eukprot:TRINITY_DN2973_c0_g1_i3.p2 TRINITY_DN2973_c0_g1~~TRINITY_DN2973_c0_g1_i3.p2  ORF type:complete len:217 (+),score=45.88 TRINITY_DN2973_c0_g1_i3:62-712(+)